MLEVNPFVDVRVHETRLDSSNVLDIFRDYDLVVDGTDNFATRYLVNDACVLLGMPYVWGSIFRFEGQVSVFWAEPPAGPDGSVQEGVQYRDLYPEPPPPGMVPSCAEGGVLGVLCASIGSVMVNEAIKLVTGIGDTLLGRLLVFDALEMSWREVRVRKDPQGTPVTGLIDYEAFCGTVSADASQAVVGSTISVRDLKRMLDERERGRARLRAGRRPRARRVRHRQHPGGRAHPQGPVPVRGGPGGAARRTSRSCCTARRAPGPRRRSPCSRAPATPTPSTSAAGVLAWVDQIEPDKPSY